MEAPAPGTTPITRPIKLFQVICHHLDAALRIPSKVAAQPGFCMAALPRSVRMDCLSIIAKASDMANNPTKAGINGTLS